MMVCGVHFLTAINQLKFPHIKKVTSRVPCHYCTKVANYNVFYTHKAMDYSKDC